MNNGAQDSCIELQKLGEEKKSMEDHNCHCDNCNGCSAFLKW